MNTTFATSQDMADHAACRELQRNNAKGVRQMCSIMCKLSPDEASQMGVVAESEDAGGAAVLNAIRDWDD